jgi:hypothetical protein
MLPLMLWMSVLIGMEESTAALPSDVRANQQSRVFFHVLSLALRYFSSHLACIALTWLAQSSRPMPEEQPPFGVIGAVWFFSHLYAVVSVPVSSTSKLGSLSQSSWQLEDVCFKIFVKRRWGSHSLHPIPRD